MRSCYGYFLTFLLFLVSGMTHRNRTDIDLNRRLNQKQNWRLILFAIAAVASKTFGLTHNFLHNLLKESSEGHLIIGPVEVQ